MSDEMVRVVVRRPAVIRNRGVGLPPLELNRFQPVEMTRADYDAGVKQGSIREIDVLSVEPVAPKARMVRVEPEAAPEKPKRKRLET